MRNCPRNIDKPITILGLEVEDMALVFGGVGVIYAISNIFIGLATGIAGGIVLKRLKRGKPRSHIQHLLYKIGITLSGFLPPIRRVKRYSPWKQEIKKR